MEYRQIEIALSVAKNLSFSEASWETSVSLSTVSKQISALEAELGIKLFERKAKSKVRVTEEGEILIPYFEDFIESYNRVLSKAKSFEEAKDNELHIGMPNGWSTLGEDEQITAFNLKFPNITTVGHVSGNTIEMLKEIDEKNIDVFFSMMTVEQIEFILAKPDTGIINIETLHLHLGIREGHSAIEDGEVDLSKLKDEVFLFRNNCHVKQSSDTKIIYFQRACADVGFSPKMKFIDSRTSSAMSIVASGQGVMPVMYQPTMKYPGVVILPVKGDPYHFAKILCYKKDNKSKALVEFKKFIKGMSEK